MGFDSSGKFTRDSGITGWQNDAAAKIKIRADLHDANDNDLAEGLSDTINRHGVSTITADIPWSGKKITQLAPGVNPTDAVNLGQTADLPNMTLMPPKLAPVDADELMIANSQSAPPWQKAKITLLTLKTLIYNSFGIFFHAMPPKAVLVDADEFTIADSVSTPTAWGSKQHSWLNLQAMIGIKSGQRLAKLQGSVPVADLNTAIESGFYFNAATVDNAPLAISGYTLVSASDADNLIQHWTQVAIPVAPAVPRSFTRRKAATVWGSWIETTSIDPLFRKVDSVVDGAGYTQVVRATPDVPVSTVYQPSPAGGNLREVTAVGTPWTFQAPSFAGNFTMAVLINNTAISGVVTFSGFTKIDGAHPIELGKKSIVYITKLGSVVSALVETMP